jgi:magnesium transporter
VIEKLVLPEIRELLAEHDHRTLSEVLNRWPPADVAGLFAQLNDEEDTHLLRTLEPQLAALTFEYLDLHSQKQLLTALADDETARILDNMSPDDRTALLEDLSDDQAERLLGLMSEAQGAVARSLLRYHEETVGRLMTPDYLAVQRDWTVRRVLDHIRTHGKKSETLNVLYVVDTEGHLVDDIGIGKILLAPLHVHVHELVGKKLVALKTTDDKKAAVDVFRKYDRTALPVIDAQGVLVGIVTIDDVLDVAEEQATRELQRFGGVEALDDPYVATPFFAIVKHRASWLIILFVGEMLTATAMGYFEKEIERAVVLALFVPLIISSGGNTGSQAATLIIRALALGELKLRDWWMVMRREILSGLLLGAILGTIGFLRISVWSAFSAVYGPHWLLVALTVSLSLVGVVLWGTISGSMLPFILKRLGFDPATSSAPFVATLVDVTGLIIYFSVAVVVLRGTLL